MSDTSDTSNADTCGDGFVPSNIPFDAPDVPAPDGRGFSAPSAAFATGTRLVSPDGSVTTGFAHCGDDD